MTRKEASEKYEIPMEILEQYEHWNLCGEVKRVMGAWQYDDQDLERLGMIMTLRNAGFTKEEIEQYMRLHLKGNQSAAERMRILKQKRDRTLDEIHFQEKRLDTLDYLRYEIAKQRDGAEDDGKNNDSAAPPSSRKFRGACKI